jgi:hypothetical protein
MADGTPADRALADELRAAGHDLDLPAPDPATMAAAVLGRLTSATVTGPRLRPAAPDVDVDADADPAAGRAGSGPAGPGPAGRGAGGYATRRDAVGRHAVGGAAGGRARGWPRARHGWLAAAAVAFGFAVLLAGSAQVRAAVVEFFRFAGVVVERQQTPPGTAQSQPGRPLGSVDQARSLVDFPVLEPPGTGPPERVEVLDGRVVSLSYQDFRLDQYDGRLDPAFAKSLPPQVAVEWTEVDGATALWLTGPHSIVYVDRAGVRRTETSRLSAPALVWQRGPVTIRLEGALTLDQARAVAESLR